MHRFLLAFLFTGVRNPLFNQLVEGAGCFYMGEANVDPSQQLSILVPDRNAIIHL
jgi:hypothetical protein